MPWIRFELGKGAIEETEREVYLRGRKKDLENDTPMSEEFAIFVSVSEHTNTQRGNDEPETAKNK